MLTLTFNRDVMALNPSARARKCQLKKSGYSEDEAMSYLYANGFAVPSKVLKGSNARTNKKKEVKSNVKNVNEIDVNPPSVPIQTNNIEENVNLSDPGSKNSIDPQFMQLVNHVKYAAGQGVEVKLGEVTAVFKEKEAFETEKPELKADPAIVVQVRDHALSFLSSLINQPEGGFTLEGKAEYSAHPPEYLQIRAKMHQNELDALPTDDEINQNQRNE